jgi:molybdopterin-synthase adenylyltransferase
MPLTDWERDKFRRQIMIPGFGEEAQLKLKAASALVTRVGGLGGPAALWLAAAGIGKLLIAHGGTLTPSNLNRQILMRGDGVGKPRIPQAHETILRFNPDVEVIALDANANEANAADWVSQVDVVLDTTPEFTERYALNRECVRQRKALVHSGMEGMEAQLTTIIPGLTPCLECFCPQAPAEWDALGFGVMATVPGALGALAALEAVKVITGFGEPLTGKLLYFDAEDLTFRKFNIERRADCPVCGSL